MKKYLIDFFQLGQSISSLLITRNCIVYSYAILHSEMQKIFGNSCGRGGCASTAMLTPPCSPTCLVHITYVDLGTEMFSTQLSCVGENL